MLAAHERGLAKIQTWRGMVGATPLVSTSDMNYGERVGVIQRNMTLTEYPLNV